jgi:ABC-2 type transport system ATP-binding protein
MKGMEFLNFMGEMKGLKDTSLRDRLVDMFQLDTKGRIRKIFILTFEDASSATDFINNSPFDIIEANNKTVKLGILGNVTELIKALDKYKVLDLDTEKSSLEDIFMHYYGDLNISQKSD